MVRVVKPGGLVTAYVWDLMNGGHPFEAMQVEMRELGIPPTLPPTASVSGIEAIRDLWAAAGLRSIETNAYTVHRTYDDFDDLWKTSSCTASIATKFNAMPLADIEILKARMRARSPADASGRITCGARVTAVRGHTIREDK